MFKKTFVAVVLSLLISPTLYSKDKDPYKTFQEAIFEQIISQVVIVKEGQKTDVLDLLEELKTGVKFLNEVECVESAKEGKEALDICLNKLYFSDAAAFKSLYEEDIDTAVNELLKRGYIRLL